MLNGLELRGFLLRKEGRGLTISGFCRRGAQVVVLEEVATESALVTRVVNRVREIGMNPVGSITVVDREIFKLDTTNGGSCRSVSLFRLSELV